MIKTSISELKAGLSEYINRAAYGKERIIIMSRGKPKAVMIDIETLETLETLEAEQSFRQGWLEAQSGDTLPLDELWTDVDAV